MSVLSNNASAAAADLSRIRVGLTADFFSPTGEPRYREMGDRLGAQYRTCDFVRLDRHEPELAAEAVRDLDAIVVLTPKVTARSLEQAERLLVLARFGVGFDSVDVAACTERDVAVTITVGAVDRPVAEATVAWMLALTHHVRAKDRLVREGLWDERSQFMGTELRDRTLGVVGLGRIGCQVLDLLRGFGMRTPLVYDPFAAPEQAVSGGFRLVSLHELLAEADFVSLHCPLNDATRGLIGARELSLMKPTAYLINTARGGIVDEESLHAALVARRIAGAALDCFVDEPQPHPSRFASCDHVLLAPHAIAWTEELFRDIGRMAIGSVLDFAEGRPPKGLLNSEVLERPGFQAKWKRLRRLATT